MLGPEILGIELLDSKLKLGITETDRLIIHGMLRLEEAKLKILELEILISGELSLKLLRLGMLDPELGTELLKLLFESWLTEDEIHEHWLPKPEALTIGMLELELPLLGIELIKLDVLDSDLIPTELKELCEVLGPKLLRPELLEFSLKLGLREPEVLRKFRNELFKIKLGLTKPDAGMLRTEQLEIGVLRF